MWFTVLGDFDISFRYIKYPPFFTSHKMDEIAVQLRRVKINVKEKLTCSNFTNLLLVLMIDY